MLFRSLKEWKNQNELNQDNIFFLENNTFFYDNVRIIGATLWSDMDNNNSKAIQDALREMNDYAIITKGKRILNPDDTIECFYESISYIRSKLTEKFNGKTIIVTHHLPSLRSIAPQFEGDPLNGSFASNLDSIIIEHKPDVWIHGHTHISFDYYIQETRILCNPRGYVPYELNPLFKPELLIEI